MGNMIMDEEEEEISRTHVMGISPQDSDVIPPPLDTQQLQMQMQMHSHHDSSHRHLRWSKRPATKRMKKADGHVEDGIPPPVNHRTAVRRRPRPTEFGREDDTDVSDDEGCE
eukprot:TRINITY_DN1465_c0_g1_i1.p3 TRINITY_DN1465_c0_g1~~TRINITY_DN1465_c0_g1_i1.p3  ORF type:complete len:112 (-),score=41.61 TRINITY_DN1465_c0_g1_i1:67-402(-)